MIFKGGNSQRPRWECILHFNKQTNFHTQAVSYMHPQAGAWRREKTLSDCLVLGAGGDVSLTVRLTWGESPLDLDTHLIGANGYHIWYMDQGSLSTEPFANLDVDDVTSYGPEVLTVLRFSDAGIYHYAVHNYSRYENNGFAPSMTASPARVELTFDGQTMVFTPPAGGREDLPDGGMYLILLLMIMGIFVLRL